MPYSETKDVAALCANLINASSDFSTTTLPSKANVEQWLNEGAAIINNRIAQAGFTVPTDPDASVTIELRAINTLYGCAMAELARTNIRLSPGERTRSGIFMDDFKKRLELFVKMDLSSMGFDSQDSNGYVGGISQSDKETVAGNGDRVPLRFSRGQFRVPGTLVPNEVPVDDEQER